MEQTVVIKTEFGCPVLYRRSVMRDSSEIMERAINMRELTSDALAVIFEHGGSRWIDGEYPCPVALAARAQWPVANTRMVAA